jgi:hypothetical protein
VLKIILLLIEYYRGHPKVNVLFNSLIFTLNQRRPKTSKFDTSEKKLLKLFFLMLHLTPIQTARAIAKLEENWSLAAVVI